MAEWVRLSLMNLEYSQCTERVLLSQHELYVHSVLQHADSLSPHPDDDGGSHDAEKLGRSNIMYRMSLKSNFALPGYRITVIRSLSSGRVHLLSAMHLCLFQIPEFNCDESARNLMHPLSPCSCNVRTVEKFTDPLSGKDESRVL